MKYSIGYTKQDNKFVILAQTENSYVAMFIRDSYTASYKNAGINMHVEIVEEKDLPKNYCFA